MFDGKTRSLSPQLKQDDEITLPAYMGYLVVDNTNQVTFVNKNTKYPVAASMVDAVALAYNQQQESGSSQICSGDKPKFCAEQGTWNAVWVLMNDLWRKGVVVSAYTTGVPADQYFVPNYKKLRNEKQRLASVKYADDWPEFSNNTYSMLSFRQEWDLPVFADNWEVMGETVRVTAEKPANISFPLAFYFNLTAQGVHNNAPQTEEYKNVKAPLYAGYLVIDQTYTYRFTRRSPFSVSLSGMVNQENDLNAMENSEFSGLYGSHFTGIAHTWAGLGVFLAKVVATGDYEIFAYTSGKSPSYNFEPDLPGQKLARHKNNIAAGLLLYTNGNMLAKHEFKGLSKFNSIMFFEPDWPQRWAKGEFRPRHEQEWP